MNLDQATNLLALSRQVRWDFPTSQGPPVKDMSDKGIQEMIENRESFVDAPIFLADNGETEKAAELAANIWRLWIIIGDSDSGRQFVDRILDKTSKKISRVRALVLYGAGVMAFRQGELEESKKRNQEALVIGEKTRDAEASGLAHLGMSRIAFEEGSFESALTHAVKARELLGGMAPGFGQAPLFMHAQSVRMLRDYDGAAQLFRQSVDLNRHLGDPGMISAELINLSRVEIHRGNAGIAEECYNEAEKIAGSSGPYDESMNLFNKAAVALLRGDRAYARALLAKSKTRLKESGAQPAPDDKFDMDWLTEKLRSNLSDS
jgi:ATP/maltotriose-dependent transcriptional regulator MalT